MVTLEDLQKYCKGKKIIIVGNCSDLLNTKHGSLIDNYEIVVRINRGYQYRKHLYDEYIGSKTTILSLGVKGAVDAARIIEGNSVNYILSPIIYSENLNYDNVYDISLATYNSLKESLNGNKPSTGISTYNFFNRFIDFARLDLIGFDFFETSAIRRNRLGHDPEKTILHKLLKTNGNPIPMNNIPTHNTNNQLFYKNNKRVR